MSDFLQIVGALAILIPYMWTLLGSLSTRSFAYLVPNLIGGCLLAVLALAGQNWGFLLLEGCWAAVAVVGLLSLARSRGT